MLQSRADLLAGGGIPEPRGLVIAAVASSRPSGLKTADLTQS